MFFIFHYFKRSHLKEMWNINCSYWITLRDVALGHTKGMCHQPASDGGPQSRCCLRSISCGMPIPTHRWVTFITNYPNSSSYFRSAALAAESRGWVSPFAVSSRGWFSVTSIVESLSAAASPFLFSQQRGSFCWGTCISARQFSRESSDLPAA